MCLESAKNHITNTNVTKMIRIRLVIRRHVNDDRDGGDSHDSDSHDGDTRNNSDDRDGSELHDTALLS